MDIYHKVAEFCAPYFADRDAIFTASSLTTAFIDAQFTREWPLAPDDMKQALFVGVQQVVRPLCRRTVRDEDETQIDLSLPEEQLLQDRYSVPAGRDECGVPVFKYVPRHRLNETDVKSICARDRMLSQHYARRADALESWFYRARSSAA
jgi:hypothetical protein